MGWKKQNRYCTKSLLFPKFQPSINKFHYRQDQKKKKKFRVLTFKINWTGYTKLLIFLKRRWFWVWYLVEEFYFHEMFKGFMKQPTIHNSNGGSCQRKGQWLLSLLACDSGHMTHYMWYLTHDPLNFQIMTLINPKVHKYCCLWLGLVFKLVYLRSEVV